jgi:hypothetical protein
MSNAPSSERRFRTLNIVDDYTRECLAIEADTSLGGVRVVRVLEELQRRRGLLTQAEAGRQEQLSDTEGAEILERGERDPDRN